MLQEFKELWGKQSIPAELEKLIQFQEEESGFEEYSQGFGVQADDKDGLKYGWCENPDFLARLYPFAQANGSGSFYAIWDDGSGKELNQMPIAVFGDEGGEFIVAENILQLMQLLTFDAEISVYDTAYFYRDEEDADESSDAEKYAEWLNEEFGLNPVNDTDPIIQKAQEKYQAKFEEWLGEYLEN